MEDFDLDLGAIEREIEPEGDRRVVLDILDGSKPGASWVELVEAGSVLVLYIEGNLEELVEGFAEPVKNLGGSLVHFRGFLIVAPPDIPVDTDRLH